MAASLQLEFLDLRHFGAHDLRALLDEESELWRDRLHWDYRSSANLLLQYVDSHLLVGYVAMEQGRVCGYTFCVQERGKAIVGDVFATRSPEAITPFPVVEKKLLNHLLETLLHTPGIERMEAQLLLHSHGDHRVSFESAGFKVFPRLFLELDLSVATDEIEVPASGQPILNGALQMRRWRDTDFEAATHLIAAAYRGHIDSEINDQYRSAVGASRFLHNIVRFPGCGQFETEASWVVVEPRTGELQAIMLCSRISPQVGHVTQVCVMPSLRRHHVGQQLLEVGAQCLRLLGCDSVTLTVTEANHEAVELYQKMGYRTRHGFDAMLWTARS